MLQISAGTQNSKITQTLFEAAEENYRDEQYWDIPHMHITIRNSLHPPFCAPLTLLSCSEQRFGTKSDVTPFMKPVYRRISFII